MVASDHGAEQKEVGVGSLCVQYWHTSTERTTLHSFRALLSSRLSIRVTTRRAASHCARGSGFARCHATSFGTSARLVLFPIA